MNLPLAGATILLASMHNKEEIVAPLIKAGLGADIFVPTDFDTDNFGTFTLDIKRKGNQYEALLRKARAAHARYGYRYILASEGSFAPDPNTFGMSYSNIELVLLLDTKNNTEIIGIYTTTDTNFANQEIFTLEEAVPFAKNALFPAHGVIVSYKNTFGMHTVFHKNCHSMDELARATTEGLKKSSSKSVRLFSDMRAMRNPTRMKAIGLATENMIQNYLSYCPSCSAPGFVVTDYIPGALCLSCGHATTIPLRSVRKCVSCDHSQEEDYGGREIESTKKYGCQHCNP
jgi:rRNA maturation endonuclease Nob1